MTKRIATGVAAAAIAATCVSTVVWAQGRTVSLFDGYFDGWTMENATDDEFALDEGLFRVQGSSGWLRSDRTYADFRMRVEFRFLTDDADSGVFIRAMNDEEFINGWPNHSYQVQLRNPAGESPFPPVGGLFRHGMPDGALRYDPADASRLLYGGDDWQTLQIDAIGDTLAVTLNGQPLMEAGGIANPEGYIGIQAEAGVTEIRAIWMEELPSGS